MQRRLASDCAGFLNDCAFKSRLKVLTAWERLTFAGKKFQAMGVALKRTIKNWTAAVKILKGISLAWRNISPPNFASPVRYCLLHVHLLSHMAVHLHCHQFHHVSPVHSFTLNLRLGYLANPFHHRPFPYLPEWFYRLSAHLTFLFGSTAGLVCTVC